MFYRISTIPIQIPPLRERKGDIPLLFRKFAADFAEKYRMPAARLTDDAARLLEEYRWPGTVRQLKNVAEQVSILERERLIDAATLREYLPAQEASLLAVTARAEGEPNFASEREILYKILFDMRKDVNDLKRLVYDIMRKEEPREEVAPPTSIVLRDMYAPRPAETAAAPTAHKGFAREKEESIQDTEAVEEESLSLEEKEREMIARALEKNHGKRKLAAQDLGISERTLYRKLKEYNLDK